MQLYAKLIFMFCHFCQKDRSLEDFPRHRAICKECISVKYRMQKYNISEEEVRKLNRFKVCQICKRRRKLVIDHCHKTNKVRAMLCSQCNTGLGCFDDNETYLKRAVAYKRKFS